VKKGIHQAFPEKRLSMKKIVILLTLITCSYVFAQNNQEATRIAVLDFDTSGGLSEMEAATLANRLRSMLVKTNVFVVLERAVMDDILQEQGFQQTGCTTTECAVEVGKMLNVQKMVSGTTGKLGRTWTMDISLIDIKTSQIEKSFFRDYKGEIDGLLNVMESVAEQIADITGQKATAESEKVEKQTPVKQPQKSFKVSIKSNPGDAQVYVNGKRAGKTPFESRAREGLKIEITLKKENYDDYSRNITVADNVNINAKLEFSEDYKRQLADANRRKLAEKTKEEKKPEDKDKGDEGGSKKWWWIGGGAVVVTAAAVVLSAGGSDKKDDAKFPLPPVRP